MYWKNGVVNSLTDDGGNGAMAESMFVYGSDVYIAGVVGNLATLWKNGSAKSYASTQLSGATSVFVQGDDFYVSGYVDGDGEVWENGKAIMVLSGGTPNSIFVITH